MKKILNVGIVGLGRIGRNHAQEWSRFPDMFKLGAGADREPRRLGEEWLPGLAGAAKYALFEDVCEAVRITEEVFKRSGFAPIRKFQSKTR